MHSQKNNLASTDFVIRWDAHGCPPFKVGTDLSFLNRYKNSGLNVVSLNVGFGLMSQKEILELIGYFQQWLLSHNEEYMLIGSIQDILECRQNDKLSITLDIEGCDLLHGKIEMIQQLYELGVRQMLFSYNNNNSYGGGCFDRHKGLTAIGRKLVKEFNKVGMLIDCSHVGHQTSLEIMEISAHPIVFSHSNPEKLVNHPRNISDEQIVACAASGGVIGINGVGIFLGHNDIRTEKIIEHIDYIVQKVGPNHVGIGLDCVFNQDEIKNYVKNNPDTFPAKYHFDDVAIAQPEQFPEIGNLLAKKGYPESAINNILGQNFFRVASAVWR